MMSKLFKPDGTMDSSKAESIMIRALRPAKAKQLRALAKKTPTQQARWLYKLLIKQSKARLADLQLSIKAEQAKKRPNKKFIATTKRLARERKTNMVALEACMKSLSSSSAAVRKFHTTGCIKKSRRKKRSGKRS